MKRHVIFLMLSAATLGLSVGCLYPEREHRREQRPEQRRELDKDDHRGRDQDKERRDKH